MKFYSIRNWAALFENNRSRTVDKLTWVAIPNRHDGENYSALITSKDGAEIFAAWVLVIQVASKCQPRGSLLRGDGKPHDPASLSLKTRAPAKWFEKCLSYLELNTDWLEVQEVASDCQPPDTRLTPACQPGDEGGKGRERIERIEGKGAFSVDSMAILDLLNKQTGKAFRLVDSNLSVIEARLKEPGVTIEGVRQMVIRQCQKWKGTGMAEYLRPATLFGKEKFDGYYAAKDQPVINETNPRHNPRNDGIAQGPTDYGQAAKRKLERQALEAAHRLASEAQGTGDGNGKVLL